MQLTLATVRRLILFCVLLVSSGILHSQVVAGIKANGFVYGPGDTVNVCRGSSIRYESAASGSLTVRWTFNTGTPGAANGIGPFIVTYNTAGFDTTFQRVDGSGGFSDSSFVIVRVSDEKPAAALSFAPDNVCGNIPIQFTNASTGVAPLSYSWSFADGDTSSLKDPTHQFLQAIGTSGTQTYSVKLVVTNALACKDSITKPVTVIKIPDAAVGNGGAPAITYASFNGLNTFKHCATDLFYPFLFTNVSTTTSVNTSYMIKWGDGSPDSVFTAWPVATVIRHVFPRGSSIMTVLVTGVNGCIGIKTYNVFLGTNPAGGLTSLGNTDICSSEALTFDINAVNNPPGTQYIFNINDGSPSQTFLHPPPASVSHFFTTGSCGFASSNGSITYPNSYAAYLLITNPCGSTSPSVLPIYVSGKPKPLISIPAPVVCVNTTVPVQSVSSFGSVVTTSGINGSSCLNSGKLVWEISPASYTLVSGSLGSFNGSPANGAVWTGGSNGLNINFTATGVYSIKLSVYNDRCGTVSTVSTICVRNPPQASFTMSSKKGCGTTTVNFTNTSPPGGCQGNSYLWEVTYADPQNCAAGTGNGYSFANGSSANSISPSITFSRGGRYSIRLSTIAINALGYCQRAFAYDTFFVVAAPSAVLIPPGSICINNSISPAATVTTCYADGPLAYQWSFTGGNPASSTSLTPGAVLYTTAGTYNVQLTITDAGCNLTGTVMGTVTVGDPPVANAGSNSSVCSGQPVTVGSPPVAGVVYAWSPAAGISNPAIANPTANFIYGGTSADTTYTLVVTASRGTNCSSNDTVEITVKRKPLLAVSPATASVCTGDSVVLTASGADTYLWSPAASLNTTNKDTVIANPGATVTYAVTGTLQNGCTDNKTIPVTVTAGGRAQFSLASTPICVPVNINSIITVTPYPAQNSRYDWYANDVLVGSNNSGTVPSYVLNIPGDTVVIKLVALSAAGCKTDSMQLPLITRPSVQPAFTRNKDSACAPVTVSFTNSTPANAGIQYTWNFGNGSTSTQANPPTVTYAGSPFFNDTTYYITLTASNGCAGTIKKDSIKVFAHALARFGVNNTSGCSPFIARFTNTSRGNNTAYYWDFGDGQTLTTTSTAIIQHTYITGSITTYSVRLVAENKCERDTQQVNLQVVPNTIQVFVNANGNQLAGCAPHTVTFNNGSFGAAQLTWNFGDGSPVVVTPNDQPAITHTYTAAGNYQVSVRLSNSCSDTTIQRSIAVTASPVAAFNVVNPLVCPGMAVQFTNTSQNADSYQWLWGDGNSSSGLPGQHTYASAGIFTVTLLAVRTSPSGFVCTDTATKQVTVKNKIVAALQPPGAVACLPYTYTATATNATGAQQVEWIITNTANPQTQFRYSGTAVTQTFTAAGNYQVKLLVRTTSDCADSAVVNFTVYNKPTVIISPLTAGTCSRDTVVLFNANPSYTGNDPLLYKWFVNGQQQGAGNPFSHQFTASQTAAADVVFTVQALAQNIQGCGDTSVAGKFTVFYLPVPAVQVSPSTVLQQPDYTFTFRDNANADPQKFYTWDMGDKTLRQRNGREITYQYGDTGSFKVTLMVVNQISGCRASDSVNVKVLYVPGYLYVPDAMCMGCSNNALRRFLPLGKGLKEYRLRIYNNWGQVIFESTKLTADGSPAEAWNGQMGNKPLQQDVYTWQIEARYLNGTEWKGMVFPASSKPVKASFITILK